MQANKPDSKALATAAWAIMVFMAIGMLIGVISWVIG
jgi:hypothetical protein